MDFQTRMNAIIASAGDTPATDDTRAAEFWARGAPQNAVTLEDGQALIDGERYITLRQIVKEESGIDTDHSDPNYNAAFHRWYRRANRHPDKLRSRYQNASVPNVGTRKLLFIRFEDYQAYTERLERKDFDAVYNTLLDDGEIAVKTLPSIGATVSIKDALKVFHACDIDAREMGLRTAYFQKRLAGIKDGYHVWVAIENVGITPGLRSYAKSFVPRMAAVSE